MSTERLDELKKMLAEDPNDAFILYAIGLELYKNDSFEKAEKHFLDLAISHPDYCPVFFKLGQWYSESDEEEKALDYYRKALEIAEEEKDQKAISEIKEAIWIIEDE